MKDSTGREKKPNFLSKATINQQCHILFELHFSNLPNKMVELAKDLKVSQDLCIADIHLGPQTLFAVNKPQNAIPSWLTQLRQRSGIAQRQWEGGCLVTAPCHPFTWGSSGRCWLRSVLLWVH